MSLSLEQLEVAKTVQNILESSGIFTEPLITSNSAIGDLQNSFISILSDDEPHPLIPLIKYSAPPASRFSPDENFNGDNRSTHKGYVSSIVHHPQGAIVKYPETGSMMKEAVAHIFKTDPSKTLLSSDPKADIQYSYGEPKGTKYDVECFLL
ncbi:hypothetical protein M422DRAFT_259606 [Sphaerobolus stellatus SS14]|uniref:Uncharacterized protein n=1 Tax=Sphaerobolus stellatus (strain SS14) TaxID=990650 RepID=A0A0C9U493_SPHS4|nr:hypothetical protein M422DRAFT_259606 [Sphaerobolus stellatus SS14]